MYRNILLVDDDQDIIRMATLFLEKTGFGVRAAKDGYSALDEIGSHHYDLIILDKDLPFVSGDQVLKALRNTERTKTLPIIMLSATMDPIGMARSKSFGVDEYIIKPPDKNDLIEKIERILGTRPNPDEVVFSEAEGKHFGKESSGISILTLGAGGMLLKSTHEIKTGTSFKNEKIVFFESLGVDISHLKVCYSQLRSDRTYEAFVTFLPLGKNETERVRQWLKTGSFASKSKMNSKFR